MSKILVAITEWFRSLLWSIAEIFLFLLDCLWKIVLKVGTLDIGSSVVTTKFFAVMASCMFLFIVFKIIKIYIKFFVDDEYREKINLSKVLVSLSLASICISGAPLIYKTACSMTTDAISHVNYFIPSSYLKDKTSVDEINMSDILIQSGRINISNRENKLGETIKLDENFDINTVKQTEDYLQEMNDIYNSLDGDISSSDVKQIFESAKGIIGIGEEIYLYFPTFSSIFLEILLAIVTLFIFAMTTIQIAMRSIICTMKYLLAPYMVATIIDPEDNSFGTWIRSICGDLLANFIQIYFTYFVLILCSSGTLQKTLGDNWVSVFAKIALFIGGLLAVQEIPNVISQFFGSSGQSMMETFRSTMFLATMIAKPAKIAGKYAYAAKDKISDIAKNIPDSRQSPKINDFSYGSNMDFNDIGSNQGNDINAGAYSEIQKDDNMKGNNQQGNSSSVVDSKGIEKDNINHTNNDTSVDVNESYEQGFNGTDNLSGYDLELDAAKYYGIDNPESLSREELQNELRKKGYTFVSMDANSQNNSILYDNNLNSNRNKNK